MLFYPSVVFVRLRCHKLLLGLQLVVKGLPHLILLLFLGVSRFFLLNLVQFRVVLWNFAPRVIAHNPNLWEGVQVCLCWVSDRVRGSKVRSSMLSFVNWMLLERDWALVIEKAVFAAIWVISYLKGSPLLYLLWCLSWIQVNTVANSIVVITVPCSNWWFYWLNIHWFLSLFPDATESAIAP